MRITNRQQVELSETIKRIRTEKGISQAEVARRLNLERGNYSRLENRGDKLSLEQLQSIAQALGVTVLEILTWGEIEPQTESVADIKNENERLRERIGELEEIIQILKDINKLRRTSAKKYQQEFQDMADEREGESTQGGRLAQQLAFFMALVAGEDWDPKS